MQKSTVNTKFRRAWLILCLGFAMPSMAIPIHFSSIIDGAQANAGAGTGSAGIGSAAMIFDDATSMFSWDIEWSGLTGNAVAAHFHGPASPNQNAGVEVNFGGISGLNSPSIGSTIINATQANDLIAGLWYINIHTIAQLGGEIRGQVLRSDAPVPVPGTALLMVLSLFGLRLRRRASA